MDLISLIRWRLTVWGISCDLRTAVGPIRCVFVSLLDRSSIWNGKQWTKAFSAISKTRPLLCLLIFHKSSHSKASPLLHPTSLLWCDNPYLHTKNNIGQHNSTQRNTTRFHKNAVKGREVDQPFSICVCSQRDRLSCGVCGSWILKREQGCDVEKANRSQSPPQRHQVLQKTREETETWTLFIDTAHQAKEFQMGGITGSIVWLAKAL